MAVEILNDLVKKFPNAELCMVGPDKDGTLSEVKNKIKEYSLSDNVKITGVLTRDEWHRLSTSYDIFINTTNVDNTPVSIIESMALGIPILSTNVGGLPYLIANGIDGTLVPPNNAGLFVDVIEKMVETPLDYFICTKKGREKVESFDWDYVRHSWNKILN